MKIAYLIPLLALSGCMYAPTEGWLNRWIEPEPQTELNYLKSVYAKDCAKDTTSADCVKIHDRIAYLSDPATTARSIP